jgi:hypothetical protein
VHSVTYRGGSVSSWPQSDPGSADVADRLVRLGFAKDAVRVEGGEDADQRGT